MGRGHRIHHAENHRPKAKPHRRWQWLGWLITAIHTYFHSYMHVCIHMCVQFRNWVRFASTVWDLVSCRRIFMYFCNISSILYSLITICKLCNYFSFPVHFLFTFVHTIALMKFANLNLNWSREIQYENKFNYNFSIV